jgi:CRP/FNR family transcriptional regulator
MTDCVIYEKTREGLLLFLEQNPDVQFMITQRIAIRLRGLMQRMEHMAFGTASQKVSSILGILAERFGKETSKGLRILIPLTQQDIAELVGLSRETTSIEIKKLMDEGFVTRTSRYYRIVDLKKLQRKAELVN